jgi:hypothetical protein
MNPVVKALMCLKGLDFVAAVMFVAEMGDLTRFAHPRALMAYLGLVPSEFSSGKSRRLGEITKSGNKHARRILVEAAWNNRFKAQVTRDLEVRQQGQPKIIRDISWKAQLRLSKRWRSLSMGRKLGAEQDLRRNRPRALRLHLGRGAPCESEPLNPSQYPTTTGARSLSTLTSSTTPNWERDAWGTMRGILGNFKRASFTTISVTRARQPREEEM